jgi:hypothetical protein
MKLRAIIQVNGDTGEKVVTLTTDRESPVEDFLVRSKGWENSTYEEEEILIFGSDSIVDKVRDIELRSDINLVREHSSSVL